MTNPEASPAYVPGAIAPVNVQKPRVCDDHHVFARDSFARLPKAEVWCDKRAGHTGAHSAVKGNMLLVWKVEACPEPSSNDGGSDD